MTQCMALYSTLGGMFNLNLFTNNYVESSCTGSDRGRYRSLIVAPLINQNVRCASTAVGCLPSTRALGTFSSFALSLNQ